MGKVVNGWADSPGRQFIEKIEKFFGGIFMSCTLTDFHTNQCHVVIEELQSLEYKDGKIVINGIVEFKPEEILDLRYHRTEAKK